MFTVLLLIVIYLAFISLGLPDSLLGVVWPAMRAEFGLPLDAAGIVAMVSIGMTVLSSLANGYIIRKIGTGKLTVFSCLLTGGALLGMSFAPSFWWIVLMALPLGFGAGSVDAGLNNYVAHHFKAHHMNWLHAFWGIGATAGPVIMAQYLIRASWRDGYKAISMIQLTLGVILIISLPLWKMHKDSAEGEAGDKEASETPHPKPLTIPGVPVALIVFFIYVAAELSVGLWGSSYLVQVKGVAVGTAARWVAMYYGGITVGRILAGFISFKVNTTNMIRGGTVIALTGALILLLPLPSGLIVIGFVMLGIGFAPIFPSMIHQTPEYFGKQNAGVIIGFQMAAAYTGSAILPPITGVIYRNISMSLFPVFIASFVAVTLLSTERLNRL